MIEIAPRIALDERILFGKPVIKGTRVPVDLVIGKLAGGMTIEEVAKEYELTREDVLAALAYAARSGAEEAAELAGISAGYWGLVERAAKQPSLASLFRFATALKVDVADLVAVGAASPELLGKSHRHAIVELLDEATAGQVKAIAICAKAIVVLSGDTELTRKGANRKASSAR